MLSDNDYIAKTRKLINNERQCLIDELSTWDSVRIYEPYTSVGFMQTQIISLMKIQLAG